MSERILYLFNRDLRIRDNLILHSLKEACALICVYVVDPASFRQRFWQKPGMSNLRWQFTRESIDDVNRELMPYGHRLHLLYGSTVETLIRFIDQHAIDRVVTMRPNGSYEARAMKQLADARPNLAVAFFEHYTLYAQNSLPFGIDELPESYSKFRKQVETLPVPEPLGLPAYLPPMLRLESFDASDVPHWVPPWSYEKSRFEGGERAAERHLKGYFASTHPSIYKSVRNELSGWTNSSKLSVWLANGCISPRQVRQEIALYEASQGANDSTQWLFVELLWREYFQWLQLKIGTKLFDFGGDKNHPPLTTFYPERFRKWCEGETPYDLVNACMKELKATGYLSNRGRQIVASCLVNELSVDWRYGAAWFEHVLIDYDVAVNWGNWQYIAGIGADPRGGRHFNLGKQTQQYDPDGLYRRRWGGEANAALDSTDAADWPILPDE